MQRLSGPMRLTQYILIAALLNVLSGIWMYWSRSAGFQLTWIATGTGISLTIGGVAAIITAILGFAVTRPTLIRMGTLGQEIQAGGGPPKPEQTAEMQVLQLRLAQAGRVGAVLLVITVLGMAVARHV